MSVRTAQPLRLAAARSATASSFSTSWWRLVGGGTRWSTPSHISSRLSRPWRSRSFRTRSSISRTTAFMASHYRLWVPEVLGTTIGREVRGPAGLVLRRWMLSVYLGRRALHRFQVLAAERWPDAVASGTGLHKFERLAPFVHRGSGERDRRQAARRHERDHPHNADRVAQLRHTYCRSG